MIIRDTSTVAEDAVVVHHPTKVRCTSTLSTDERVADETGQLAGNAGARSLHMSVTDMNPGRDMATTMVCCIVRVLVLYIHETCPRRALSLARL